MIPESTSTTSSYFTIGPIQFNHHVQDIAIQEEKASQVLPVTRTDKTFIVESGTGAQQATVRLLISGLDEINLELRKLILLFRSCPVISVSNELLRKAWGEGTNYRCPFIPVTLNELSITTVPDIPIAFYVTISMSRIDVTPISKDGILLYQQESSKQPGSQFPSDAYYLNKWLNLALDQGLIPKLSIEDLTSTSMKWAGRYLNGSNLGESDSAQETDLAYLIAKDVVLDMSDTSSGVSVQSETAVLRNIFAFNRLETKGYPFAQHMGVSSKMYSMDIVFDEQNKTGSEDTPFQKFLVLKEAADRIIRDRRRFARITGWKISSPVMKLLGTSKIAGIVTELDPGTGTYVPLQISIETTKEPFTKAVRIDLAESNFETIQGSELSMYHDGSDYDGIKSVFMKIADKEYEFRKRYIKDAKALTGQNRDPNAVEYLSAYQVFWPIDGDNINFSKLDTFGLLNRESLKATFISNSFDEDDQLKLLLSKTLPVAESYRTGTQLPSFLTKLKKNYRQFKNLVNGIEPGTDDTFVPLIKKIDEYVGSAFEGIGLETKNKIVLSLLRSYIGEYGWLLDISNESGQLVIDLAKDQSFKFSNKFLNALFDTIARRKSPTTDSLKKLYDIEGLHAAYFKLLVSYLKELETNKDLSKKQDEVNTASRRLFSKTTYPDLLLPTYRWLYGNNYKSFAPTYSDIGSINPATTFSPSGDESAPQDDVCVLEDDIVSPTAWFYAKRYKADLVANVKTASSAVAALGHTFQLSLPFNTDEIDSIEKELKNIKTDPNKDNKTLSNRIKSAYDRMKKTDELAFEQGMRELSFAASDVYANTLTGPDGRISLLLHNIDNLSVSPRLSMPGLVGELHKVAKDGKYLRPADQLPYLETNFQYRPSDRANEQSFFRGTDKNVLATLKSSLDQLPDTFEDPIKLFPAVKIYLLEKRGSDLIGDDSFFSVNPIISVNITADKDDADLAIITIADPLFLLQHSFFPQSNIIPVKKQNSNESPRKLILNSVSNEESDGFLKRQKIQEGRRIQIRMGYGSVPRNLETVFTGKIVEIQHGDVLTLVCQGWKAELVNNQVSFYNDNVKNWGARDLAVMAMEHANPDGFGDFYPQMTLAYIKRNITSADLQEIIDVVLSRQDGVENINGARAFSEKIGNALRSFMGMRASGKKNEGLDTRLKNIWVADLPNFNNFAYWRYWTNTMPSQINDSWIVPMKPAWEALKEASRHAWNTIVQVVPFDGEATLFFGHPDAPYYYTKGRNVGKKAWSRYKLSLEDRKQSVSDILGGFKSSSFYIKNNSTQFPMQDILKRYLDLQVISKTFTITDTEILMMTDTLLHKLITFYKTSEAFSDAQAADFTAVGKPSYSSVVELLSIAKQKEPNFIEKITPYVVPSVIGIDHSKTGWAKLREAIIRSTKSEVALAELQDRFGMAAIPVILEMFYGVPVENVHRFWPSAASDLPMLISGDSNEALISSLPGKINVPEYGASELISFVNSFVRTYQSYSADIAALKDVRIDYTTVNPADVGLRDVLIVPDLNALKERFRSAKSSLNRQETVVFNKIIDLLDDLQNSFKSYTTKYSLERFYLDQFKVDTRIKQELIEISNSINDQIQLQIDKIENSAATSSIAAISIKDIIDPDIGGETILKLKVFIFYLNEYLKSQTNPEITQSAKKIKNTEKDTLPPHTRVFRVHHYVEDGRDIIKNNLVASMKDMWNTVIIEHPAHAEATSAVTDELLLGGDNDFYSGVQWVYYPKSEITGVVGLQFHPGLTLRNKKLRVFTELNCQSNELAAKLACTHLADGLRRMYRGNILTVGRIIKPHDRIVLDDKYNQMSGPLEVESVIQHWGVDTGWVTDLGPQAVCDANPGAAILETAALEDTFAKVFNAIDYASDALTVLFIIGTFGSGTPFAQGVNFSIRTGVKELASRIMTHGVMRTALNRVAALGETGKLAIEGIARGGGAYQMLGGLLKANGPLLWGAAKYYGIITSARQITHAAYRMACTTSFVINAQKAEQLPVIFSPLYFNGIPFTAGIDTDDPIWTVQFASAFWSFRELNAGAEKVWEQLFGEYPNESQYRIR